jgi:stachyose synthetase
MFQTLEYLSEEYGGRVELAKAYFKGLTSSLSKNFSGSGLIASMQQCNDFFFLGTNQISIGRVGKKVQPNGLFFFFFLIEISAILL